MGITEPEGCATPTGSPPVKPSINIADIIPPAPKGPPPGRTLPPPIDTIPEEEETEAHGQSGADNVDIERSNGLARLGSYTVLNSTMQHNPEVFSGHCLQGPGGGFNSAC